MIKARTNLRRRIDEEHSYPLRDKWGSHFVACLGGRRWDHVTNALRPSRGKYDWATLLYQSVNAVMRWKYWQTPFQGTGL